MTTRTGRCSCASVRYELAGEPLFTHACHCTQCQRRAGGAFCMSMILEPEQLRLTQGQLATFEIAGDNGTLKQNRFCVDCGTMIHGAIPSHGILYLRPGTLDDTGWVRAQAHIFVKSKQPWVELPGDVPCFMEYYEPNDVWPAASLARLAARVG